MTDEKTRVPDNNEGPNDDQTVELTDKKTIPTTGPESEKQEKKSPVVLIITVSLLVLALLALAYVMLFTKKTPEKEINSNIKQMEELTQDIRERETEVKEKQDEIFTLMNQYKEKTGQPFLGANPLNLNEEEKKLLEKKINEEKDVSIKSLLEEINDKTNEIQNLQTKIAEIEALLPKPHIVQAGESHFQIALDFLMKEKNIEKERAMQLVEQTLLVEPMVPGFKVWNFYSGEEYGTSVTQGSAPISPNQLIRNARQKLVDARDKAISEKEKLAMDIKDLEAKRDEILQQLDMLNNQKEELISKVSELNEQNLQMQTTINSLFYLVDLERNLKKEGILKGGFLKSTKLKNVSPEYFQSSIDLRSNTAVTISASALGISKIKGITVYPNFYVNNTDFKIDIDAEKLNAAVTILNPAKFKNERIVISVN